MCIDGITSVKFMGHNLGQLISKFGAKLRDIDINKMTVSLIKHTVCIDYSFVILAQNLPWLSWFGVVSALFV